MASRDLPFLPNKPAGDAPRRWGVLVGCILLMGRIALGQNAQPSVTVELGVDRERIYQYETFMLTVKVVSSGIRLGKGITLDGLPGGDTLSLGQLEDLPIERSLVGRSVLETRRYRARCRALKAGTIRLAPSVAATQILQQRTFFGRQWVESPIRLAVPPLEIPIAGIPDPPPGMRASGAVGTFAFEVAPHPLDLAVGDLIKMQIRITGDGYLDTVSCPAAKPDAGFKVYPPRLVGKDDAGITFEQVLIPLSDEATEIPALVLNSFDARAGAYQSQTQGPFRVTFHARRAIDRSQQYRPALPSADPTQARAPAPSLALRAPGAEAGDKVKAAHEAASQACESGYFEAALEAYASLEGQAPAWLLYNRGIVYLAAGQYGQAIAALLRSRHAEPGREETQHALQEACRAAGVAVPAGLEGWRERIRNHPRWKQSAVIIEPVTARLAPAGSARALFECKPGQVVTVTEQSGAWLGIRRGDDMGWIAQAGTEWLAERAKGTEPPFSLGL